MRVCLILLAVVLLVFVVPAEGQLAGKGAIKGNITVPSGAVVPNAIEMGAYGQPDAEPVSGIWIALSRDLSLRSGQLEGYPEADARSRRPL
jgi:hypothetical protein